MSNLINAKLSYLRIAPRKVRLVVDLIRGKSVDEAQAILRFTVKKATGPLIRLLNQGVANAKDIFQIEQSDLYISEIRVDEGPKLKRWRARARGRAFQILKRTSHISLTLNTIIGAELKKKKKKIIKTKTKIGTEVKKDIKIKKINRKDKKEVFKSKIETEKTEEGGKKIFRRKAF